MKAKRKTKAKAPQKILPSLKKSLGELMKDEDGYVSKETILKVGLSTVAALGVAGALTDIASGARGVFHTNQVMAIPGSTTVFHTNITTHSSY